MTHHPAIRTVGLIKDYGRHRALNGLDLEVRRGETFGFLGPNGAGKSTTIRVLLDLLRPDGGTAEVLGLAPRDAGPSLRARIGYLPGELHVAGRTPAGDALRHFAALRGGRGRDRIAPLAERLSLDLRRPVRALSKGNKQKVGVIQAFMHAPELLILDEPTSGLDPLLQQEVLSLIREAAAEGATVLMSSHVLREVEEVADRVAIVRDGRTIDVDEVAALRARAGQRVRLRFAEPVDPEPFRAVANAERVEIDGATVRCVLHGEPHELLRLAARHHAVAWEARDRDLEELFLDVYRLNDRTAARAEPGNGAAR